MSKIIKQAIVIRHDLKMRRGKQIAQASHACMAFILDKLKNSPSISITDFSINEQIWINGNFRKICLRCNSEEELVSLYNKAIDLKIKVALIKDDGLTEFHGIETKTCIAIGPDESEKIDEITGGLELL